MAKTTIRLPSYTRRVKVADGFAYYWELPHWARPLKDKKTGRVVPVVRHGQPCPVASSALGTNHDLAVQKAEGLCEALEEWRKGAIGKTLKPGSVAWLFRWYREQDRFIEKRPKTRKDYERIMHALCERPTKAGPLGSRLASLVDGPLADALYKKLRDESGDRSATYAMQVCRLVWHWAVRHKGKTGIKDNPFAGMRLKSVAKRGNRATSRAEYDLYRATAHEMGFPNIAAAAALCFECCQRVSHVFGFGAEAGGEQVGLEWSVYDPGRTINLIQLKTGNEVLLELAIDVDGEPVRLYPELEQELGALMADAPRDGAGLPTGQIILDARNGQPFSERWMSTVHRRICEKAGLPKAMTFTGFRHGGITEIGDSGEDDVRPISGHKTLQQTRIYNKANAEKGRRIALKRREHVERLGAREEEES